MNARRHLLPVLFFITALLVVACGSTASQEAPAAPTAASPPASSAAPSTATSPSPTATGGVTMYDHTDAGADGQAMYEFVTPADRHIYVDVVNWDVVAKPPTADDILLITHDDIDHLQPGIVEAFPGQSIVMEEGSITLPDVTITSVPSVHDAGVDPATAEADIYAFSQIENPYAGMEQDSTVGYEFIDSVNPRIFIPTHLWFDEVSTK